MSNTVEPDLKRLINISADYNKSIKEVLDNPNETPKYYAMLGRYKGLIEKMPEKIKAKKDTEPDPAKRQAAESILIDLETNHSMLKSKIASAPAPPAIGEGRKSKRRGRKSSKGRRSKSKRRKHHSRKRRKY
jgi:hypothetical protein